MTPKGRSGAGKEKERKGGSDRGERTSALEGNIPLCLYASIFRISKSWDVAPRGFEHISPLQYKAMQGIALHFC